MPSVLFDTLDWRLVGPFRGGRCSAVSGVIGDNNTYYMGSAGGGVFKTTDAGKNWTPIAENQRIDVDHQALWINPKDGEQSIMMKS